MDIVPQKGTFVSLIDLKYVENKVYMRLNVEKDIINTIIVHMTQSDYQFFQYHLMKQVERSLTDENFFLQFSELDNEFHYKFYEIAQKTQVWEILSRLSSDYKRFCNLDIVHDEVILDLYNDHEELIKRIIKNDREVAEKLITNHLTGGFLRIKQIKMNYGKWIKR